MNPQALSIDELFTAAFSPDFDADTDWGTLNELRRRDYEAVFERCAAHVNSEFPNRRARALDVLAQLGAGKPPAERPHFEASVAMAIERLEDGEAEVVSSAAWALSHLRSQTAQEALLKLVAHSDPDIRWAVATGVATVPPAPGAVEALILLMEDADDDVRNSATFGLGQQLWEIDSPEIRAALRRRLGDSFEDARDEALWGLALRREASALATLVDRLSSENCIRGDGNVAALILDVSFATPVEELIEGLKVVKAVNL